MYKGARGRGGREVSGDTGNESLPPSVSSDVWFVTLSQYLACRQASSRANYCSSRELIREERGRIATWV